MNNVTIISGCKKIVIRGQKLFLVLTMVAYILQNCSDPIVERTAKVLESLVGRLYRTLFAVKFFT